MRTTKAYLAGLGTTGIMIGATLLLVVLGTGFVAFDSLPARGAAGPALGRMVVDDGALAPPRSGKPIAAADRHRMATRRLAAAARVEARGGVEGRRAAREDAARRSGDRRRGAVPGEADDRLGGSVGTGDYGGEGGAAPGEGTGGGDGSGGGGSGGTGGSGTGGGGTGEAGSGGGGGT